MAATSLTMSLPQMVDLALNAPDKGNVNFNVLQSLLHVLIQQMDLLDCKVEFRGDQGEQVRNLLEAAKKSPPITLTEYVVSPAADAGKVLPKGGKHRKVKRKSDDSLPNAKRRSKEEVKVEKILNVIERRKNSKEEPLEHPLPLSTLDDTSSELETVVLVETGGDTREPRVSVAIPKQHFDDLEKEVKHMHKKIKELTEMPATMGLVDALKDIGADKTAPVLDMFQILNLTKRADAADEAITKLASMFEDVVKEHLAGEPHDEKSSLSQQLDDVKASLDVVQSSDRKLGLGELEQRLRDIEAVLGGRKSVSEIVGGRKSVGEIVGGRKSVSETAGEDKKLSGHVAGSDDLAGIQRQIDEIKEQIAAMGGDVSKITPGRVTAHSLVQKEDDGIKAVDDDKVRSEGELKDLPTSVRVEKIENKFDEFSKQILSLDNMFHNQVGNLTTQLNDLEAQMGELLERINSGHAGTECCAAAEQNVSELFDKLTALQTDMEDITNTANILLADKEEKQRHMDALLEQIELLKTIKADREDLQDALADKADACAINRKVSHDQFDAACDDLSRGIEEALAKLTQQENLWQQALDDIQREIGNKLDKMELSPLRDFINNKLKTLQEKVKALAALKKETEAAGTKSKFLRCALNALHETDVVMRKEMDASMMPTPTSLPPTKSMGPYLAYELDALRKQQKCTPFSRNMNHFESAFKNKAGKDQNHVCNRYCGGSHTTTTPQQRVTRLGHFLQQWGPDVEPIEGHIRGTDGQMYRARSPEDEALKEAGDAAPVKQPSVIVQGDVLSVRQPSKHASVHTDIGTPRRPSSEQPPSKRASQDRPMSASSEHVHTKRVSITGSIDEKHASKTSAHRKGSDGERRGSAQSTNQLKEEARRSSGGVPTRSSLTRTSMHSDSKLTKSGEDAERQVEATIPEETASEAAPDASQTADEAPAPEETEPAAAEKDAAPAEGVAPPEE